MKSLRLRPTSPRRRNRRIPSTCRLAGLDPSGIATPSKWLRRIMSRYAGRETFGARVSWHDGKRRHGSRIHERDYVHVEACQNAMRKFGIRSAEVSRFAPAIRVALRTKATEAFGTREADLMWASENSTVPNLASRS